MLNTESVKRYVEKLTKLTNKPDYMVVFAAMDYPEYANNVYNLRAGDIINCASYKIGEKYVDFLVAGVATDLVKGFRGTCYACYPLFACKNGVVPLMSVCLTIVPTTICKAVRNKKVLFDYSDRLYEVLS